LIVQETTKGDYRGKYDDGDKLDRDVIELINTYLKTRDEVESKYYNEVTFHEKDVDFRC